MTTCIPRILFADDAAAARVLVAALLRRMNLEVEVAQDGEEVIALVRRRKFDLILLDIDMPVMDGMATARRIRQMQGEEARTPIIAVSGYLADTVNRGDRPGDFDATVPKPVTLARMWAAMAGLLPEGHVCAERSSVLRVARSEAPLIDTAAGRSAPCATADGMSKDDMAAAVRELRSLAGTLERAMAEDERREAVTVAACQLHHLSSRIGAPRLQRRATVLAAMAPKSPADELRVRTRDVISCALATISEFKKQAALRV